MAKIYKVWVEIEEFDTITEEGQTLDGPGASVASFTSPDAAWQFAEQMNAIGAKLSRRFPEEKQHGLVGDLECGSTGD